MSGFTLRYLRPHPDCVWRFGDQGKVVSWHDGETVAFAPELHTVLEHVATVNMRLPPFPGIFVLLAAGRHRGAPLSDERGQELHNALLPEIGVVSQNQIRRMQDLADSCRSALEVLEELPDEFWSDPRARTVLAGAVFDRPPDPHETQLADRCIEELRLGIEWADLETEGSMQGPAEHRRGLEELRLGLLALDPGELEGLLRAGVPTVPDAAGGDLLEELPPIPTVGFIHELENDPEHGSLARLSKQCLAALHIPQHKLPDDEPELSGAANLSNRGPLHRLLLSELALDDEVLAQRVALNEALYLDRERTSEPRSDDRTILIDTGIRTWGNARVVATAVAMALAAQADPRAEIEIWRSSPSGPVQSELGHRAGILQHLAALDPLPRPTEAMRRILADRDRGERFLVTHPDVLADPLFESALRERSGDGVFVVTVDANAALELHHYSSSGHCSLRKMQLEAEERPAATDHGPFLDEDSPLPLDVLEELPFFLPHGFSRPHCLRTVRGEYVLRAKDRRLMLWSERTRLGEQLLANTPAGSVVQFARIHDEVHLVIEDAHAPLVHWWIYHLDRRQLERLEVPWRGDIRLRPRDVAIGTRSLFLLEELVGRVWRMGVAEPVSERTFDQVVRIRDGCFFKDRELHVLRVDGGVIVTEKMPSDWDRGPGRFACTKVFQDFRKDFVEAVEHEFVMRNVQKLAAFPNGDLAVITRRGVVHGIGVDPSGPNKGTLCISEMSAPHLSPVTLEKTVSHRKPRMLTVARWRDGSEAFFDKRGLLHLRSADAALPMLTLALLQPGDSWQGGIAAATSDGRRYGKPKYVRDPNCDASEIMDLIRAFTRRLT